MRAGPAGLNLAGTFNVDNTTLVDPPPADGEADEDYDLYARFWSLQSYLANPRLCMDAAGWLKFATVGRCPPLLRGCCVRLADLARGGSACAARQAVETVLSLFEKEVFEQKRGATASTTSPSLPPTLAAAMAPTDFLFCPKFLTSRKLFRLQVASPHPVRDRWRTTLTAALAPTMGLCPCSCATRPCSGKSSCRS